MTKLFTILLLFTYNWLLSQSEFIDSIHRSIHRLPENKKIEHLLELADLHAAINLEQAMWIATEGLNLARKLNSTSSEFDGMILLADLSVDVPDLEFADSMYQLAAQLAEKMEEPGLIMKAMYGQSKSLSMKGKREESIKILDEIISIALANGDSLMYARSLMSKGINLEKLSMYEASLHNYYEALDIFESLDDQHRISLVHTNIGMTFLQLHRNEEALSEFQFAYRMSEEQKDTEGLLINSLNIGVAYQRLKKYEEAKKIFREALATAKSIGSWYDIALLTANLGTTAMQQHNYAEARILLERAVEIKDSIGYQHELPHTLNSLAETYLKLGDYNNALSKATDAGQLAAEYQKRDQLSVSHRILSEVYAASNNYALAYNHLHKHKMLSDSVFSAESDQAISNLKIQYETTLKENQITTLTAKNKKSKTAQLIYIGIGFLIFLTGASMVYALYIRRSRDKMVLTKERELHELQSRFFANISHEFRTPLTLILGPIHNLRQQFKGTKEDSAFRIIQVNAERLLLLINQILDLTKVDNKVLELKKETFDVTKMIRGICSSFDSLAESRSIHYSYEVDDRLALHADMRRLEIVLINLISNAFKFTPDHGSIYIMAKMDTTDQTFKLQVTDSGTGIREENMSRIFDRYYHDDREAHSDFEGAGIGLALCKHIIEMHGGVIGVTSKVNEGSVFTVTLPYTPASVNEEVFHPEEYIVADSSINEVVNISEPGMNSHAEKPILLLVEDRKDMRDYISSLLRNTYQVIETPDAFKGREQAIEHIPDIIVSDVMMPRKSGLELCHELKSDMRTSHIPVLLLTAKSSAEDRISGLETEADVYLTKPFIPQELELNLRNLIASRQKIKSYYTHNRQIEPSKMAFNSIDEQFLESIVSLLEQHHTKESFSVEELAELMNLSRSQLHRKLIALTGQAPNRLIRTFRLKRAYDMVVSNAATMAEISYRVGFGSPAYFTKCFVEEFGATPGEIRNRTVKV